ncbi:MAG: class I SAM-dependent methyltransferase [Bacteroidota bacterium]
MTADILEVAQPQQSAVEHDERSLHRIHAFVEAISTGYRQGKVSLKKMNEVYRGFGEAFLTNTIQGHGWRKPFGYAGDFLMIDKIYTHHTANEPEFQVWDEYFHRQAAPQAVRNRKEYFKQLMRDRMIGQRSFALLNVASGPARDLAEVYTDLSHPQQLHTTCVDMDKHAIAYAKSLNLSYLPYINFVQKNVLRFHSEQTFNLIWSAGLFDYFDDRLFVTLLRRFRNYLKPGGEIVIGNFNQDHNPSRAYMEIFGDWFLYHRTEQQLVDLATKSGFEHWQLSVNPEPENVNLFLHIKTSRN